MMINIKITIIKRPSKVLVEQNLKSFLAEERVPLYCSEEKIYINTTENNATFQPYPVGYGPWEETTLAEDQWQYLLPSTMIGSGKSPASRIRVALSLNYNIEWVYDSRGTEVVIRLYFIIIFKLIAIINSINKKSLNRTEPYFVLQKLLPVSHENISENFKYLQHFGKIENKPPNSMTINTISFHLISIEIAQQAGKEFLKIIRKNGMSNLSCSIKTLPPYENEKTQLIISAMASVVKGNGIFIKFKVSLLNNNDENFKFNWYNYGKKIIELGGPDGSIFQTFDILIHPEVFNYFNCCY